MKTGVLVTVLLSAWLAGCCNDGRPRETRRTDAARSATTEPVGRTGFRFVRSPVVIFAGLRPEPATNIYFDTFVRLNRALPRDRRGYRAVIVLEDRVDLAGPTPEDRKKLCYSESSGADRAPALRNPRDGQRVTVTIELLRPRREVARAEVRARRVTLSEFTNNAKRRRFARELGCAGVA